jgi:hypothetical protein
MQVWECRPPDTGSKDRAGAGALEDDDACDGDGEVEVGALEGWPEVLGPAEADG